jgi:hypothetical protein
MVAVVLTMEVSVEIGRAREKMVKRLIERIRGS